MKLFCFTLMIGALASAGWAGDVSSAPVRMASVVRTDARTGKLVRRILVTPKPVVQQRVSETVVSARVVEPVVVSAAPVEAPPAQAAGKSLNELVASIAAQHSLPPQLIDSVIKVESNYNARAVSPKGALGLMQLIPATARRFGVSDVFDPVENIQGGARYLKYLLELYNNDYRLALAAYNAGEGAVARYGDVPPYAETRNYLVRVRRHLEESAKAAQAAGRKQPPPQTLAAAEAPRQIEQVTETDGTVRYVAR